MPDTPAPSPTRFRTGGLSQRKPTRFHWSPDAAARQHLAADLGLVALHQLAFSGQIDPVGRDEFRLTGQLTAQADQACIVTLASVPARVDEPVLRRFVADLAPPQADEVEMPEDDSLDPMPEVIDIPAIAAEALVLALPDYPRAPGASFAPAATAQADAAADDPDAPQNPFAALADRLSQPGKPGPNGTD